MPLYDYECQQCHRHTEKIQKFSDAPLTECPHCGGRLERVLHAPAVAFKGGGWYADGYGNKKSGSESKSESKTGDTKSSETKSDAGAKSSGDSSSSSASSSAATPASSASASSAPSAAPAASVSGPDKK